MKILDIFKKKPEIKETSNFAEFFAHATSKQKIKVFTKAAELANKDQRKFLEKVGAR